MKAYSHGNFDWLPDDNGVLYQPWQGSFKKTMRMGGRAKATGSPGNVQSCLRLTANISHRREWDFAITYDMGEWTSVPTWVCAAWEKFFKFKVSSFIELKKKKINITLILCYIKSKVRLNNKWSNLSFGGLPGLLLPILVCATWDLDFNYFKKLLVIIVVILNCFIIN